jgi:uridine kinase
MSSPNYCDLSGFKFLTFSQKQEYSYAFQLFNNIQAYNSNVSTLRAGGALNVPYYQFLTNEEKTKFLQGRFLHIQAFPNSNWDFVQQN